MRYVAAVRVRENESFREAFHQLVNKIIIMCHKIALEALMKFSLNTKEAHRKPLDTPT